MRRLAVVLLLGALARGEDDPYLAYVRGAPEFTPVETIRGRWDTWYYMPWRYQWTIGFDDAAGRFCRAHGINGGFTDHGRGPFEWLEKWGLRFYNDHTAGKGTLYLRGAKKASDFRKFQTDPRAVRSPPLDAATLAAAKRLVEANLARPSKSPMRLAYALDDEISYGAFVIPLPWRVDADDAAYKRWLARYYGRPTEPRYVTPEDTRKQLGRPLAEIDFAPLLDRMTYNDTAFALFVRALVAEANRIDPETPCGYVGGQPPNLWGGYDYAKLARTSQFQEVYDIGSAPEIVRSFAPRSRRVSTHFHKDVPGWDSWHAWSRFAHGQDGMIGWVEGWFDGKTPRPWLKEFAPVLKELGAVQGPKLRDATWGHDGIALYYSHPSIQVSWLLDAEAHGKTWPKRNDDHIRGTSHLVRKAWENILNDAGLQYDFLSYDEVVRDGVPERYKVLILPACYALSDIEARRIREFVARGGRVTADFMCGLFDQHGRGRRRGALDDLFGVRHDGTETARDFFSDRLWVEADQDKGYRARRWEELLDTLFVRLREGFTVAELRLAGPYVKGGASYLNVSPQRYLLLRAKRLAEDRHRKTFLRFLGVRPWVRATGDRDLEVTYWTRGDKTYLFVVKNPVLRADGTWRIERGKVRIRLEFREPVRDLVDERSGEDRGDGGRFRFELDRAEAVFVSFRR